MSPADDVRAIKQALANPGSCNSNTTKLLKTLLDGACACQQTTTAKTSKKASKEHEPRSRSRKLARSNTGFAQQDAQGLTGAECVRLATEVVNICLKSLSQELQNAPRKVSDDSPCNTISAPLTTRSINVPSSPAKLVKNNASIQSREGITAVAECARAALALLRKQTEKAASHPLPAFQVESAMSALISKLLALEMITHACKEIRLLALRLGMGCTKVSSADSKKNSTPEPDKSQPCLASLLCLDVAPDSPQKLSLVVTTQLHILKLLKFTRAIPEPNLLVEYLNQESITSPASLIELLAVSDGKDKCLRQLGVLAHAILALSDRINTRLDDHLSSTTDRPSSVLKLRVLHLQVMWKSLTLAEHKIGIRQHLSQPIKCYIEDYLSHTKVAALARFSAVRTAIETATRLARTATLSAQQNKEFQSASLDFDLILQGLSNATGDHGVAKRITEETLSKISSAEVSGARKAAMLCRAAVSAFQDTHSLPEHYLLQTLEQAVITFSGSVDASSEELDELLLAVSCLRKAVTKALNGIHDKPTSELPSWVNQASQCVLKALTFTLRYIGKLPDSTTSASLIRRYEERKSLAEKTARGTIESVVVLAKRSAQSDSDAWSKYEQPLKDCLSLAEQLHPCSDESAKSKADYVAIPILVSNVYWLRYLAVRQSMDNHRSLSLLLGQSTAALKGLSFSQQKAGLLLNKLERLAYVHEQSQSWSEAGETYQSALNYCFKSGLAQKLAEKLRWVPTMTAIMEGSESRLIGKIIEGHCRSLSYSDRSTSQSWKLDSVDDILYGFVLELHLTSFAKLQQTSSEPQAVTNAITELGRQLLGVYTEADYPLRRLRALSSLAGCGIVITESSKAGNDFEYLNPAECALLPFHDHLIARNHAILAIKQMQQSNLLLLALDKWQKLVGHGSITSWQALADRIGDVEDWHDLLNTIAKFAEASGLLEQRIIALDLLVYTTKLSASFSPGSLIRQTSSLASEIIALGFPEQAYQVLSEIQKFVDDLHQEAHSVHWSLAQIQQRLAVGDEQGAEVLIKSIKLPSDGSCPLQLEAHIHFLTARQQEMSGRLSSSTFHSKQSVKIYMQAWTLIERKYEKTDKTINNLSSEMNETGGKFETNERSASFGSLDATTKCADTTHFWPLIRPLFEALMYAADLHLRYGLVSEARHYTLEALRIAERSGATVYTIRASALQSTLETRCGEFDLGKALFQRAVDLLDKDKKIGETQRALLQVTCALSSSLQDEDNLEHINEAYAMLDKIRSPDILLAGARNAATEQITNQLNNLKLTQSKQKTAKSTHLKIKALKSKPSGAVPKSPSHGKIIRIEQLKDRLLERKASGLAMNIEQTQGLIEAESIAQKLLAGNNSIRTILTTGELHLKRGLANLQLDPLLNIIPEAILAQPVVVMHASITSSCLSSNGCNSAAGKRKHGTQSSHDTHLNNAAACCKSLDSINKAYLNTTEAHEIGQLTVKTFLTIGAVASSTQAPNAVTSLLGDRLEYGRNFASIGAQAIIEADKSIFTNRGATGVRSSLDAGSLMPTVENFQQDFVDIIPSDWHVVSISLSKDDSELKLGAFKAAEAPFVISIPLSRDLNDGPENAFTFENGRKELNRIIDLANYSTHEAVDYTKRGAKAEWWEARAALDSKLRDLLTNIENIWLSGFKGILMNCFIDERLMVKFEKSFVRILDKHLPSRRIKKAANGNHVSLNPKIFELFLRLGASQKDPNIDESILDLLYFVVDILWFNGEKNACDEIDFDPMIIEIREALTSYHENVKECLAQDRSLHTVLILDRRLHAFPWESLPCMKGQSVSRLPSLYCLRQRILQMQAQQDYKHNPRYTIDRLDGAYVLNPSGDLRNTQKSFEQPLSMLRTWSSKVNNAPKEEEIVTALSTKSLYLYFGHGSGGQYIRTRAIRRLNQCAVALLMGCSSGTLTEAGEFESFGTPLAYLYAGAPAVVGTLWDVTDKDIDRFSTEMLESWGLLKHKNDEKNSVPTNTRGTAAKGKGKGKQRHWDGEASEVEQKTSIGLDAAIAAARESCIMRYLNGAAPVMYGIPVFLK